MTARCQFPRYVFPFNVTQMDKPPGTGASLPRVSETPEVGLAWHSGRGDDLWPRLEHCLARGGEQGAAMFYGKSEKYVLPRLKIGFGRDVCYRTVVYSAVVRYHIHPGLP